MFKALFNIILNLMATLVQIIMLPINAILVGLFPDISQRVVEVTNNISHMFDGMSWAIGLIPSTLKLVLITIIGLEIAKHSAYIMTHVTVKIWNLIQKLKFW